MNNYKFLEENFIDAQNEYINTESEFYKLACPDKLEIIITEKNSSNVINLANKIQNIYFNKLEPQIDFIISKHKSGESGCESHYDAARNIIARFGLFHKSLLEAGGTVVTKKEFNEQLPK